jgi:hypothetical protein
MMRAAATLLLLATVATCGISTAVANDAADDVASTIHPPFYLEKVKPLLAGRCLACHGGLAQEAGLRLDTAALIAAGGDSGPAVVAGVHAESLLIARVADPEPASRMPPEGEGEPLTADEIAMIAKWIDAGCPAPADEEPEADPREHWAFQPRVRPELPAADEGTHPIDAFVNTRLAAAGIAPQPEAPRHVLVRRLFLDLVGVPPTADQLQAIMSDHSSDWYEQLVDTLLADPRHGQRWARHWMDIWRYSDWWGLGDQLRNSQKHMWHFRDWIVESLNADLGYDEMLRLMLAADELHPRELDRLRATGFLTRNWFLFNRTPWMDDTVEHVGKAFLGLTTNCAKCHDHKYDPIGQADYYRLRAFFEPLHVRLDVVPGAADVAVDGIPRVFDALLEEPTYRFVRGNDSQPDTSQPLSPGVPALLAFDAIDVEPFALPKDAFEPARRPWVIETHLARQRAAVEQATTAGDAERIALATAELTAVERRAEAMQAAWAQADAASEADRASLEEAAAVAARAAVKAEREVGRLKAWAAVAAFSGKLADVTAKQDAAAVAELEKQLTAAREKVEQATAAVEEPGESFTRFVGAAWTPTRFHHSGSDDPTLPFPEISSGRRTALARWITDPRHPLTSRVAANHLWGRHLGEPLVATVFDFGRNGAAPTHPELLDWLAAELVDSGWSMRHLHRLIVTSAAYRRSSSLGGADAALAADPDNRLLWRRPPQRLEAQVIRDCLLATAGLLDASLGGPSIPPGEQAASRRRGLYFWHSDISRNAFLTTFDDAGVKECYRREQSIVPQQALALANGPLIHETAAAVADSITSTAEPAQAASEPFVTAAFERVLLRPPSPEELVHCQQAVDAWQAAEPGVTADTLRARIVWALFNHNDFVTLR